MNTRLFMIAAAVFYALVGIGFSFLPQELLHAVGLPATGPAPVLLQIGGGALIGWAIVNWTARGLIIGGIYARPLTLGNLVHTVSAALALAKALPAGTPLLWAVLAGYGLLAIGFGYLTFGAGGCEVGAA